MATVIYPALVLIVAFFSIAYGFRRGISMQLSRVLGFAFGAAGARVLASKYSFLFKSWAESWCDTHYAPFVSNLFCAVAIYCVVFFLFSLSSGILRSALSVFEVGMLNRLCGAFFSLFCSLLWLSILLNIALCVMPESGLIRYEKSDDGNLVATVMAMTPAILGCFGADDFAHRVQLRDASYISCNIMTSPCVINVKENVKDNFIRNVKDI